MKRMTRFALLLVAGSGFVMGGCGGKESEQSKVPMTQAQRDSVLAESKIPGSSVVGKALATADSTEARAKRLNDAAGD